MELRNGKKQMSNSEVIGTLLLSILAAVVVFFTATLCLYNNRSNTFIENGFKEIDNERYVCFHNRLYKEIDYETHKEEIDKHGWLTHRSVRKQNGEEEPGGDPWTPDRADYILLPGKANIINIWAPSCIQANLITSDMDEYHPEYVMIIGLEDYTVYKIYD